MNSRQYKRKQRRNRFGRRNRSERSLYEKRIRCYIHAGIMILAVLFVFFFGRKLLGLFGCSGRALNLNGEGYHISEKELTGKEPEIDVQLLDINEYSRPGTPSDPITGIVIHYTANPGSTAQQNRNYFNGLKDSKETQASSHFIVGLKGEIVQCVPSWEIAYASNERNHDTVSIECCHPDESGKFTEETYASVVRLTAWLCTKFGLTEQDVIRHYDVTGKNCPKYLVEHEKVWEAFREDVKIAISNTTEQR